MPDRFYTPEPLAPGEFVLSGPEAHHVLAVRRFAVGERITLFNGDGYDYPAAIVAATKKHVTVSIEAAAAAQRELPYPVIVAAALPKGDRANFLIEKLTELGVSRFVPLITERSVVIPKASVVEKFSRAVIEASKQCGRNRLMTIDPPAKWSDWLQRADLPSSRSILDVAAGTERLPDRQEEAGAVAIGPEGGFTPEEVAAAVEQGWAVVSLGPRVLRVETTAIAVAALLAAKQSGSVQ
jgi:16S rRNA (uracil1498-N3)-methyltransferase